MDKPRIFSIVVTYNGLQWYDRCLGSLQASEVPVTTIVIDNASSDGSVDYIRNHFPDVVFLRVRLIHTEPAAAPGAEPAFADESVL